MQVTDSVLFQKIKLRKPVKFTQSELLAIDNARVLFPNLDARLLAAKLHDELAGIGRELFRRTEAAICSEICRHDEEHQTPIARQGRFRRLIVGCTNRKRLETQSDVWQCDYISRCSWRMIPLALKDYKIGPDRCDRSDFTPSALLYEAYKRHFLANDPGPDCTELLMPDEFDSVFFKIYRNRDGSMWPVQKAIDHKRVLGFRYVKGPGSVVLDPPKRPVQVAA